ncbi:hypothetical protein [Streptomyces sp. SID13031]|uniref:hypothetical protein n=1 Tax=Streptomyces sp. SID13031 TaxID=2706046 RepID=UPI0013C7BC70|nr:hypothetical protein [Streptomyces sp. SID13031]NEA36249.1 hypothetical protein [Streptomyces sp. SID13031]
MFTTLESVQAETAYRQERAKRDFGRGSRRQRQEQATKAEPRHARRALRPTTAA